MGKIGVVGSINMDMTVKAERIPLKGETLKGWDLQYIPGGKGANQAVAMAMLGAEVEMFGCVGDDAAGESLVKNLRDTGVETGHIKVVPGVPTGLAMITVGENDNTIIVVAGTNDHVDIDYVNEVKDSILECEIVLLQHEIPQETVEYVIALCADSGVKVVLNPGPARPVKQETLEKVTYLTPNEHEAVILFGRDISFEEMMKKYPEKLVITQGSRGVSTCLKSGEVILVPARKSNVVDTTGAGDTLNGAFTVAVTEGKGIADALAFANTAAGLSTEKFGAQGGMPTLEEVRSAMPRW
ncbi:ribokinase [Schaedlerella sp.]|jgi:ribokinase|uniref:ribokinase n=1 Tax=Schaedlerella sp. TaxID=2676057 RepID=UPI001364779B|nr:ribokinase [uncultured Schaedlerella sp.]MCI8767689.1 ribokinase [Ruminococcus sp.]MCI9329875.1 ribokinase [Ruminococcus sp.]NBJ00497.1 ribokinase [Lachnospiraceae bacterium]